MEAANVQSTTVSVVIPTYNSAAWLGEALDSVLAQIVRPTQIIVIDDGSTDHTATLVPRYPVEIQYVRQSNQGVSAARNLGLSLATQPYVAFLDADDVWHPTKLKLQMAAMNAVPDLVLLGTRPFAWPSQNMPSVGGCPALSRVSWGQLVVKNRLTTSSVIVRRDAILQAGGFDTTLQGPEDRDMWLRLARIGAVANLEEPLTGYREVPGSVSKQAKRCYDGMRRIIDKLDETGQLRGHRLLRRRALSQIENSVACIWSEGGSYSQALRMLMRSIVLYPWFYDSSEVEVMFERPRRFVVYLLRLLRLKSGPKLMADSAVPAQNSLNAQPTGALYV